MWVAELGYEPEGREFESLRARHFSTVASSPCYLFATLTLPTRPLTFAGQLFRRTVFSLMACTALAPELARHDLMPCSYPRLYCARHAEICVAAFEEEPPAIKMSLLGVGSII